MTSSGLPRILVTGAAGFIGRRLVDSLSRAGAPVRAQSRAPVAMPGGVVGDLTDPCVRQRACRDMEVVVHCAGFAHAFDASQETALRQHHEVNFLASARLAEQAAQSGVGRFVFLSSVKAAGHDGFSCMDEDCALPPVGAYGEAKRRAEDAMLEIGARYGMDVVVLRLSLTYGAGGRGNLERLVRAMQSGWLPLLPETGGLRSVVHVNDAVSAIELAALHLGKAGGVLVVAHPKPHSTRQIQEAVLALLKRPPGRGFLTPSMLRLAGHVGDGIGWVLRRPFPLRGEIVDRLLLGECYSPARIQRKLGWQPELDLHAGLAELLAAPPGGRR